ncbi:MAG: hypothetical protein Q9195_005693 [Heterodermia aff. obscurata]
MPSLALLDPSHEHVFMTPTKKINEGNDVSTFLMSKAYTEIMTFVIQLNRSMFPVSADLDMQGTGSATQSMPPDKSLFSDTVRRLRDLLDELKKLIESNPPDLGPRRFGNVSFRKWYADVESRAPALLETYVPLDSLRIPSKSENTPYAELESYLLGGFGSAQRLDYGTGHELSFLAFLGCIWKLGGFQSQEPSDLKEQNIVLGLIDPYLQLVRKLIKTYTLEPAGSHGVWGLDDHSFLPYVFGSAQYGPAISTTDAVPTEGSHPTAPNPADITKASSVTRLRTKNLYFGAIGFINDVKSGPFWEHSPTLYDISGVKGGWGKINKGMLKMYNAEVLSKFPVVQHFRFGSLFPWDPDPNARAPPPSAHASSQPLSNPPPGEQTPANPSNPSATTAAPWARSSTSRAPPISTQQQRNPGGGPNRERRLEDPLGMPPPPPTKAPWARKPD